MTTGDPWSAELFGGPLDGRTMLIYQLTPAIEGPTPVLGGGYQIARYELVAKDYGISPSGALQRGIQGRVRYDFVGYRTDITMKEGNE